MRREATRRDTILVVDDTPETLGFLTDTLDHAGFTVLIATDGESALDLVDQITPDLVLMDAVMPGMTGFEACRRLKREKLLNHLPVIFMTGLSETEHVVEGWPESVCTWPMRARRAALKRRSMRAAGFSCPSIGPVSCCGVRRRRVSFSHNWGRRAPKRSCCRQPSSSN
jgi:CheY-like chemotaxis protein